MRNLNQGSNATNIKVNTNVPDTLEEMQAVDKLLAEQSRRMALLADDLKARREQKRLRRIEGVSNTNYSRKKAHMTSSYNNDGYVGSDTLLLEMTKEVLIPNPELEQKLFFAIVGIIIVVAALSLINSLTNNLIVKLMNRVLATVTLMLKNCASYYELIGFFSISLSVILFDVMASFTGDDNFEILFFLIFIFVIGSLKLLFFFYGPVKSFYLMSPTTNGEQFKRLAVMDFINFSLAVIRIVMCWLRYILYDLQVEHIDMALHYSEEIDNLFNNKSTSLISVIITGVISVIMDLIILLIMVSITIFKYAIALFLLWLILDLFILRLYVKHNENYFFKKLSAQLIWFRDSICIGFRWWIIY